MKVLIVDDSRAMQTIVRRGIEQLGYSDMETRKADDGMQALDIIREWEPDLVLSDWHMPEMSGLEMLHALNRQMLPVKVGFVTTETSESRKIEALSAGAKFFVQKPFTYKTLHEAVLPILQGSTEGEAALEQAEAHNKKQKAPVESPISLPTVSKINQLLNHFSKTSVSVEPYSSLKLRDKDFPCLLGLFEDQKDKRMSAIAILDLSATCILGACLTDIAEDRVNEFLRQRAVPKAVMANCQKLMQATALLLQHKQSQTQLKLRSINILRKKVSSIETLMNKPDEDRIDLKVLIPKYGSGRLTLISS
jgi:DNA-binding response OmpR family regulator